MYRNDGVLDIEVPGLVVSVTPDTPWDWNFTTTAQTGLGGRPLAYPRGHVLGGSSCASEYIAVQYLKKY